MDRTVEEKEEDNERDKEEDKEELSLMESDIDKEEEEKKNKGRREKEKDDKKEDNEIAISGKRKRHSSATILAASLDCMSESATVRMEALLEAKRTRTQESTRSRAAKILSSKHYSKWAATDIEKALDLIEDEKKVDICVSLDGKLRDSWLKRKIASL